MKIAYKDLINRIGSKPSIEEVSSKLFQLGHEHEYSNDLFDIEFTPNRGDCLSVNGLLRDLSVFYDIDIKKEIYKEEIQPFDINFKNNAINECPNISFLKIEIDHLPQVYKDELKDYFTYHDKKNNFFTDISNYLSYETGQPLHCYDSSKIDGTIILESKANGGSFINLFGNEIELDEQNLVFSTDNKIINLAGIVGGKNTSCSSNTKSVIVECAYFDPEAIIGKATKYNIKSDAAYKFERGVDPLCQIQVLRRFIKLVEIHSNIINVEIFSKNYERFDNTFINYNHELINKILGIKITNDDCKSYLNKLGFEIEDRNIKVPSYRSDIKNINDIAEEIARVVGFNNILREELQITVNKPKKDNDIEYKLKTLLIDNGFYEVINNPFITSNHQLSIKVDNPLDSSRGFLRTNLKNSLLSNLIYNENRQKDSIKFFEISDIYTSSELPSFKRSVGILASGRIGKNYKDFSKKITIEYITDILEGYLSIENLDIEEIPRKDLKSKSKNKIIYIEFELSSLYSKICEYESSSIPPTKYKKYKPISEFPSSSRDLSFLIKNPQEFEILNNAINDFNHPLIQDKFLFDFYQNDINEIKAAYRFIFQSLDETITDIDVNEAIDDIIKLLNTMNSVSIPGLKN